MKAHILLSVCELSLLGERCWHLWHISTNICNLCDWLPLVEKAYEDSFFVSWCLGRGEFPVSLGNGCWLCFSFICNRMISVLFFVKMHWAALELVVWSVTKVAVCDIDVQRIGCSIPCPGISFHVCMCWVAMWFFLNPCLEPSGLTVRFYHHDLERIPGEKGKSMKRSLSLCSFQMWPHCWSTAWVWKKESHHTSESIYS